MAKAPAMGSEKNTIKQVPLIVALQLRFLDCDDQVRPFPKDMAVAVVYGNDQLTETHKISDDKGTLCFPVTRDKATNYKFLRIKFSSGQNNYVICEKSGEADKTTEIGDKEKADEKAKNGARFFRLPPQWSFLTSEWSVATDEKTYDKADKEKKFLLVDGNTPKGVGSKDAPIAALLDPHWQFVRFEYFDRYYGHTDHENKPIGIPPIVIEGIFKAKTGDEKGDTRSNWTRLQGGDQKKSTQCLPWIVQAKPDGSPEPKPDKESMLKFAQQKDTYIKSNSATDRVFANVQRPFPKDFLPGAERLKYYDLPELWKSKNYWCSLSDQENEKGFFEKVGATKTTKDKPLVFSLDDIVLTDDKFAPLKMRQTDKVALFYHEFLDANSDPGKKGTGGRANVKYLKNGLFRPGPDPADVKVQNDARTKAEDKRRDREQTDARSAAEYDAEKKGASRSDIKLAGDKAVANLANDAEAQKRIKSSGASAAGNASRVSANQGNTSYSSTNLENLSLTPDEAQNAAREDQRAIEIKPLREQGEEEQRKIERTRARRAAEESAAKTTSISAVIKAAGDKAVANLANDSAAQERIKMAGQNATTRLSSDAEAKERIKSAGIAAKEGADAYPYSDVERHKDVPNYISDYPHWTRLLTHKGNLFDIFDKRTNSGDVIGARAAVRWVDATSAGVGVPAAQEINPLPSIFPKDEQDEAFFVLQPYYRQNFWVSSSDGKASNNRSTDEINKSFDEWNSPLPQDNKVDPIGRCENLLLRCSGFDGDKEDAAVFVFHRVAFDFTSEPNGLGDVLPSPESDFSFNPPNYIADATKRAEERPRWITNFVTACGNRWSGNDNVNNARPWINEKKLDSGPEPTFRAQVVTFLQNLPDDLSHFNVKHVGTGSWMTIDGEGEFEVEDGRDTDGLGFNQCFAGAHEYGHANGQPDDYAPTENGQVGFGSNDTPGAPFIKDEKALMKTNHQIRTRSYWHLAEWLRLMKPFSERKFQIKLGSSTEYEVPHYKTPNAGRNFTHWPVKVKINHRPSLGVLNDTFLYFLGKDEFQQNILPNQPDGILVILVKMRFKFDGWTDKKKLIKNVFNRINTKISNALNSPSVYARFNLPGVDRPDPTFEKCILRFAPRFEVSTSLPAHFEIKIAPHTVSASTNKPWIYWTGAAASAEFTELNFHGQFAAGNVKDDTNICFKPTAATYDPWQTAKNAVQFKAEWTNNATPRKLEFHFPENSASIGELNPVVTRLENLVFKYFCNMVQLSDDSADASKYYGNADSYKNIVRACVNDSSLNPTMSRM